MSTFDDIQQIHQIVNIVVFANGQYLLMFVKLSIYVNSFTLTLVENPLDKRIIRLGKFKRKKGLIGEKKMTTNYKGKY